jgi:hypothetical protein
MDEGIGVHGFDGGGGPERPFAVRAEEFGRGQQQEGLSLLPPAKIE